jgi:hypothetical protein
MHAREAVSLLRVEACLAAVYTQDIACCEQCVCSDALVLAVCFNALQPAAMPVMCFSRVYMLVLALTASDVL